MTEWRVRSPSGSPVESDLAGGPSGHRVAAVVGVGVVSGAEQEPVAVGAAALGPGVGVVQVAHAGWPVAALGGAATLFEGLGDPLRAGVEAPGAAEVEDLGLPVEDRGDDPGLTGELASQGG